MGWVSWYRKMSELDITKNAYRWGYVHGKVPVLLRWGTHEQELEPGSSFSIQKNVSHSFRSVDKDLKSKLVVMESNPDIENPLLEIAFDTSVLKVSSSISVVNSGQSSDE